MSGIRSKVMEMLFGTDVTAQPEAPVSTTKTAATPSSKRQAPHAAPRATQDSNSTAQTANQLVDDKAFENKLISILSERPECMVGRLNLIGVDKIKEALGTRWEAAEERVHQKVSGIIARHLGADDVVLRHSDTEYMICHAKLTDYEARLKSFEIAQEIHTYFIGDTELSDITIRTAIAKLGRGVSFETVRFDDVAILEVDPSHQELNTDTPRTQKSRSIDDAVAETRAKQKMGGPDSWRKKLDKKSIETVDTRKLPYCSFAYRPAWQTQRNQIIAYVIVPVMNHPQLGTRLGYLTIRDAIEIEEHLDYDLQILDRGVDSAIDLLSDHARALMVVPVSFDTLTNPQTRQAYLNLCKEIPTQIRELLVFQLYRLPNGVPPSRVRSAVEILRSFSRYVFATVNLECSDYQHLQHAGVTAICLSLPHDAVQKKELTRKRLNLLVNHCKQHKLLPCIDGITEQSILQLSLSTGINFISGDLLGKPTPTPTPQACPVLREFHAMMHGS